MDSNDPRARARHHHSGEGHFAGLERHAHQHRRYPRPRRFRRRGRAHPLDGRWRGDPRRCRRRARLPQTKFVLGKALAQGLRPIVAINKIDRPGRAPSRSAGRDLRSVHRARSDAGTARLPGALWRRQAWLDVREARRPQGFARAAARQGAGICAGAEGRSRPVPHAGHHHRAQSVPSAASSPAASFPARSRPATPSIRSPATARKSKRAASPKFSPSAGSSAPRSMWRKRATSSPSPDWRQPPLPIR